MKLLVVDDEPSVRKLLKRFFEARGYDVCIADNGVQGWTAARDEAPDLVVSDVAMPEMDGYELVRTIRRNPATAAIPVILLSAHSEANELVAGYESGADDYVTKPVDMEVLGLKIDALLRRARAGGGGVLPPTTGKLITVTSAKGGVGTTVLAANLAVMLGRRSETVCAYDLNIEHGDLPVMFDLQPKMGISDAVRDMQAQGEAFQWDDYLVRHHSGAKVLAAPLKPHDASAVTEDLVAQVTQRLRALHDYVIADLPPSYNDTALSVYEQSDRLVVITSPELTSLRRTKELIGVLSSLGVPDERVLVVLNRIIEVPAIDARRAEAFLRRPVAVTIPHGGQSFPDSVSTGRPVALSQPTSPAVTAIGDLVTML
ncbi:MAG TPA: response regulator [Candidatus Dormibacteraeota bacterium]|jgi:pilus assembly protein CpaE|nr:response regulator [Candidatus Dormibacteraeota bacterium]